jgi:ribosomal-protein-alanine N-acetyltransferase
MTPEDLDEVIRIEQTTESPWSAKLFASEFELTNGWRFVFQDEAAAKIVGFIIGTITIDEAEIRKIAVAPEFRQRKIASFLLGESLAFLKEQKAASCFLELRKSNRAAFGLYEKHGFKKAGERKKYYKNPVEDALIMHKNIG